MRLYRCRLADNLLAASSGSRGARSTYLLFMEVILPIGYLSRRRRGALIMSYLHYLCCGWSDACRYREIVCGADCYAMLCCDARTYLLTPSNIEIHTCIVPTKIVNLQTYIHTYIHNTTLLSYIVALNRSTYDTSSSYLFLV